MKKVSLNDLAIELGVSKTLVSLVLNNKADQYGIKKEVQQRVKQKAIEFNYRPNQTARSLRSGKTNTIGLIVDDLSNSFQSNFFQNLEALASKSGYHLLVTRSSENTDPTAALLNKNVDGIIISAEVPEETIKSLSFNKYPVVTVNQRQLRIASNSVDLDFYQTMFRNCNYLLENGKQCITIAFENKTPEFLRKEVIRGAEAAFKERGLPSSNLKAISVDGKDGNEISNVLKELKGAYPNFNSLISVSDVLTIKIVESLNDMGITIPTDFSVLSLFDNEVFNFTFPNITANQTPFKHLAEKTFALLISQITNLKTHQNEHFLIASSFIERASV